MKKTLNVKVSDTTLKQVKQFKYTENENVKKKTKVIPSSRSSMVTSARSGSSSTEVTGSLSLKVKVSILSYLSSS